MIMRADRTDLVDEILKPPLRERERVEKALANAEPKDALILALLINQGGVRGDWRRALVRRRIQELVEGGNVLGAIRDALGPGGGR